MRRMAFSADRPSKMGATAMCDYSLHYIASRSAKVGDELVTTEFANTMTRGFASTDDPTVAVCLQPGTELAFKREPEYWPPFTRWLPRRRPAKLASTVARFRQINLNRRDTHHDALEFSDGTIVLLTRLCSGQRATVLQLPADVHNVILRDRHESSTLRTDLALARE
jgi:hypothetical protein